MAANDRALWRVQPLHRARCHRGTTTARTAGVRDVLATHILKATGSYEHAGYAIQDTAETVARHYGRFLPKDKSALAAQIINKVWLEIPVEALRPPEI